MGILKDKRRLDPSDVVQQQFLADSNINNMIARVKRGANNPDGRKPIFGDFTYPDFQAAQNALADVQMQFQALPARIRSMFQNRPEHLIRFVNNPDNRDQALKMGLIYPEQSMDDKYEEFLTYMNRPDPFGDEEPPKDPPQNEAPVTPPKPSKKASPKAGEDG